MIFILLLTTALPPHQKNNSNNQKTTNKRKNINNKKCPWAKKTTLLPRLLTATPDPAPSTSPVIVMLSLPVSLLELMATGFLVSMAVKHTWLKIITKQINTFQFWQVTPRDQIFCVKQSCRRYLKGALTCVWIVYKYTACLCRWLGGGVIKGNWARETIHTILTTSDS